MSNREDGPVAAYQREVASRRSSLPPSLIGGDVPWADRPHGFSVRPGLVEMPLQTGAPEAGSRYAALSRILHGSSGLVGRRLQINWNCSYEEVAAPVPRYRRPAVSGGGLYPIDLYVVARSIPGLPDGLLHYCELHGALALLRAGDYHGLVAAGCSDQAGQADLYVLLSVQYWRNIFKYQQFGYHVVNFDCGAMSAAIDQTARDIGVAASMRYALDDAALSAVVGLDAELEAVLGVVALRFPDGAAPAPRRSAAPPGVRDPVLTPLQRSRRVAIPPLTQRLHRETCQPGPPGRDRPRGSVYGQFDPSRQIARDALGRMLQRSVTAYDSDLAPGAAGLRLTRLMLVALRVAHLEAGVYEVGAAGAVGARRAAAPDPATLQSLYYLRNQNVAGCGAVFVVVGFTAAARRRYGARSIRMMNAEAGLVGQRLYGAAGGEGCGGSAALGFNAVEIDRLCGLEGGAETALLLYFAGRTFPDAAFEFRF